MNLPLGSDIILNLGHPKMKEWHSHMESLLIRLLIVALRKCLRSTLSVLLVHIFFPPNLATLEVCGLHLPEFPTSRSCQVWKTWTFRYC